VPKCSVSNRASKLLGTPILFVTIKIQTVTKFLIKDFQIFERAIAFFKERNLVFVFRNAISSKYIFCQFQISFIYFFLKIFKQTIVLKPNQRQLFFLNLNIIVRTIDWFLMSKNSSPCSSNIHVVGYFLTAEIFWKENQWWNRNPFERNRLLSYYCSVSLPNWSA